MMHLLAPAKINLHLRVGRRRDDGFHPLLSWMCTVGLFDSLTLEADADAVFRPRGGHPSAESWHAGGDADDKLVQDTFVRFELSGDGDRPDLPRDGTNLVARIAAAFVQELRSERDGTRKRPATPATPPPRPASREGGDRGTPRPPSARAAAEGGEARAASAGAAPSVPGMVSEDPAGPGNSRALDDRTVIDPTERGPAGFGAGAVRGAEGSGRSDRRGDSVGEVPGGEQAGESARPGPSPGAGVRVALEKRIPIGAGLGGGSADAAYTLVALDRLLSAGWAAERLSGFAARFGSDVPFLVHAALGHPSSACRGRGEVVRPVARPAARWAVIFSPPFGLATREVYERFDLLGMGHDEALEEKAEPDWKAWAKLPARELLKRLVNDLEPAAFSVSGRLEQMRAELEGRVGRTVRMSGSGSSLFTLFDADEIVTAREAAAVAPGTGVRAVVAEVAPPVEASNG